MTPRVSEEHLEARRNEILDAACRCFARGGFDATTIADIRSESGLSTGAIYGHFESKQAIVRAAADRTRARLEPVLEAAEAEPDPRRGLERLLGTLAACATGEGEPYEQGVHLEIRLWAAALHSDYLRELVARWYRAVIPVIADLVRRIRDGEGGERIPSPELVARTIVAAIQGSLLQRALDEEGSFDPQAVVLAWLG